MSIILDKLKAIKLMFSAEPTPPAPVVPTPAPVKQEAHEYQTNDGLNLMIDKLTNKIIELFIRYFYFKSF